MIKRTSIYNPTDMFTDPYYNDRKYVGKTGYFKGRYKNGYQCVNFAVARTCHLAGKAVCYYTGVSTKDQIEKPMFNRAGYGNAVEWMNDTLWEKGTEPKLGAIMVYGKSYGGGYGHVRVVEEINGNNIAYSGANESNLMAFKTIKKPTITSTGFLGYIYNPYVGEFNVPTVVRDESKNQVEVIADSLKCRSSANGEYLGYFAKQGLYDIKATEVNGEYTWAKLADNVWIATNDNWTKLYLVTNDWEEKYKALETRYNALNNDYQSLEKDYKNELVQVDTLTTTNKTLQSEVDSLKNDFNTISEKLTKIKEIVQ